MTSPASSAWASAGSTVSVPLPSDEDGYDEKECPNPECLARFRIHTEDWSNPVTDERAFCPVCRHEANRQSWFTSEQVEYAQAVALRQLKGQLDQAFSRSARRSQTRPSSGMLSITFSYRPGRMRNVARSLRGSRAALLLRGLRVPLRIHRRRVLLPGMRAQLRSLHVRGHARDRPGEPGSASQAHRSPWSAGTPRRISAAASRERPREAGDCLPAVRRGDLRPPARPEARPRIQRLPATG